MTSGHVVVAATALAGPLAAAPFTRHMVAHMAVAGVIAPLIAWAVTGGAAGPVGRIRRWWGPLPASGLEFLVVWTWHAPVLHDAAATSWAVYALEQGSFLGAALLFWVAVFGADARRRAERTVSSLAALALTLAHMTMLGVLLALGPRALYGHVSLADQQQGGALMVAASVAIYVGAAVVVARRIALAAAPAARAEGV